MTTWKVVQGTAAAGALEAELSWWRGLPGISLQLVADTEDPDIIRIIEEAAEAAGVEIHRVTDSSE